MKIRTTDNNGGKNLIDFEGWDMKDLSGIANQSLKDLEKKHPKLLIFPQSLGQYRDDVEKSPIFHLDENKLTTYNLMGFIGRNATQLTITSRFAKDDKRDYFLHYMLHKVFAINILDFDQTFDKDNIWDFLLYLFPHFLKKAYAQGLYKAYKRVAYNDANVRGAIDMNRHIRTNIPFAGKIAYTTREHSYDNSVTQLIKHTIESIKIHPLGNGIFTSDNEIRDIVGQFNFVTQASYNKNARQKVVSANLKPISHPYFTEYSMLQKICLQILRQDKLTYGAEEDKIYGLLFDGAWLWEEYLNTLLKDKGFTHSENKIRKNARYLLQGEARNLDEWAIYPDFYKENLVLDAKYKRLIKNDKKNISRDDKFQIITYMHALKTEKGGFIFPSEKENCFQKIGTLNGYGGEIYLFGLKIPQEIATYGSFKEKMAVSEMEFVRNL
ncbi:MAG: hypothetical protein RIS64_2129 [Bacteroidota bacterium]|jgi:5-methylcytosine-specific restriction endonuclease McrBC regulatory subunit McrC